MRVISGELKGRRLRVPETGVRPTSDRVREALFSMIENHLNWEGLTVLDLYAGSGSLGIEAISRGAKQAVFVEETRGAIEILRENLSNLGISNRAVISALSLPERIFQLAPQKFDLILVDPPYEAQPGARLIEEIFRAKIVNPGALILVESSKKMPFQFPPAKPGELSVKLLKDKTYGDTQLHFGIVE